MRAVKLSSRLAVLSSLVLLPLALALPLGGLYPVHAYIVAGCLLPLFVAGVAASYTASALAPRKALREASLVGWLTLAAAGLFAGSAVYSAATRGTPVTPLVAGYILVAAAHWASTPRLRGTVRLSVAGLALAYTLAAAYTPAAHFADVPYYELLLGLVYALPVTAIYAVTIHSLPRTYGGEPRRLLVLLLYGLQAAGTAAYIASRSTGLTLLSAAMLVYPLAARFSLLREALRRARRSRGPVRGSHLYYLWGHIAAAFFIATTVAGALYWLQNPSWTAFTFLVHSTALGFVACHIALHVPLMLPVILGIPSARRYNPTPYVLLAAALAAHPVSGTASLALFSAAMLATLLVAWPTRHQ